jgi:4-methoxybenzoate monooxygenase (O-demethylating)
MSSVPVLDVDPFAMDVLRNPYPFQKMLRDTAPVVFFSKYNSYGTGRFEEVRTVLKEWPTFTSAAGAGLSDIRKPDSWRQAGPLVESDPPVHTGIRAVLTKIISPAVVRRWQTQLEKEAVDMVARLCDAKDVDGAKDIAEAYITKAFPEALGLKAHRENMVTVGNYNFNALGPKNELFRKSEQEMAKIADWYAAAQQREGVVPGSFAEMIFHAEDAGELAPGVGPGLVRTFLRGGMDTTISGISSMLMILSTRPELWARLRHDRSRVKFVFDETIRLESPIQTYFRTTTKPVELGGTSLNPDVKLQIFVGAANRDPRKWENPDAFDIDRGAFAHLAFGHGVHVCAGQLIARIEAECVLNALLDRIKSLRPAGEPEYRLLNTLRTLETLPLHLEPA